MVLSRKDETIEHAQFKDLRSLLSPDALLVLNNTRVLPARRYSDNGALELLFLEKVASHRWRCLVRPGKKARIGALVAVGGMQGRVEEVTGEGHRIISFSREINPYADGSMPLPPYIARPADREDEERYQTVFAQHPGAVAAPTAGLHFTKEILAALPHVFVTLHVGPGTFRPVQVDEIADHKMHAEKFSISGQAADQINAAGMIVAVGTTSVRVLESACDDDGRIEEKEEMTDIFIYPPFRFRVVDALLTNFHLPGSTLLMLVSAFAGREFILRAYGEAIGERYRFYSYGDCMLIL